MTAASVSNSTIPLTSPPEYQGGGFTYAIITLLAIMGLLTILGNLFTILAFGHEPSLKKKPGDLLILSLSVADFGTGFVLLGTLPLYLGVWPFGKIGCKIFTGLGDVFLAPGIFTITFISVDRYLLVSKPYTKYLKKQTRKRIFGMISIAWGIGLLNGVTEVILWDLIDVSGTNVEHIDYNVECRSVPKHNSIFTLLQLLLFVICPLLIIELLSVGFIIHLRRRLHGIISGEFSGMADSRASSCVSINRNHDRIDDNEPITPQTPKPFDFSLSVATKLKSMSTSSMSLRVSHPKHVSHSLTSLQVPSHAPSRQGSRRPSAASLQVPHTSASRQGSRHPSIASLQVPHTASRRSSRSISIGSISSNLGGGNRRNRYVKPATTLAALVITLNLCMLPFCIYTLIVNALCPVCSSSLVRNLLSNLFYLNSFVNPFLYVATMSKMKVFYQRCLRRIGRSCNFV